MKKKLNIYDESIICDLTLPWVPEAENKEGEMLGYDAVYSCIKANGKLSADEQKQALLDLGSAWLGELQNQDDITIVVVKKSNPLE